VAKALRDFSRTNPLLVVKGGVMGTSVLSAADAAALAEIPSRDVLLARLAGLMAAPLQQFAGLLQALPRNLAYGLKALLEQGGAPGAPLDEPATVDEAPAGPVESPVDEAPAGPVDEAPEQVESPVDEAPEQVEAPVDAAPEQVETPVDEAPAEQAVATVDEAPPVTSPASADDGGAPTDPPSNPEPQGAE